MKKLFLLLPLFLLASCSEYDGALYKVEIQHTAKSYNILDTIICGFPRKSTASEWTVLTEDNQRIENVRSVRVLEKIRDEYSEADLNFEYKKESKSDSEKWPWEN